MGQRKLVQKSACRSNQTLRTFTKKLASKSIFLWTLPNYWWFRWRPSIRYYRLFRDAQNPKLHCQNSQHISKWPNCWRRFNISSVTKTIPENLSPQSQIKKNLSRSGAVNSIHIAIEGPLKLYSAHKMRSYGCWCGSSLKRSWATAKIAFADYIMARPPTQFYDTF